MTETTINAAVAWNNRSQIGGNFRVATQRKSYSFEPDTLTGAAPNRIP